MPDPLIEIRNLTVSFAVGGVLLPAVKELTLTLQPNEVVGLVGESGSGKSTALLAVMNYLPGNAVVETGSIVHGGVDLLRADRATLDRIRGRRIAMIYQDPTTALNPAMTVGAQIAEVLTRHLGMDGERARQRTHELLGLVQLDDPPRIAAAFAHQLSGGMQQRVMIAMALSGEPDVLLMDEPTTALDVIVQAHVLELVRSLHRQIRSAIVFVSHNLAAVAQLADRIGVLYAGELMELGPAAQVLDHPSNPYTRGLIAAVPRIGARQLPRGIPGTASPGAPALRALCLPRPLRLRRRSVPRHQAGRSSTSVPADTSPAVISPPSRRASEPGGRISRSGRRGRCGSRPRAPTTRLPSSRSPGSPSSTGAARASSVWGGLMSCARCARCPFVSRAGACSPWWARAGAASRRWRGPSCGSSRRSRGGSSSRGRMSTRSTPDTCAPTAVGPRSCSRTPPAPSIPASGWPTSSPVRSCCMGSPATIAAAA